MISIAISQIKKIVTMVTQTTDLDTLTMNALSRFPNDTPPTL